MVPYDQRFCLTINCNDLGYWWPFCNRQCNLLLVCLQMMKHEFYVRIEIDAQ